MLSQGKSLFLVLEAWSDPAWLAVFLLSLNGMKAKWKPFRKKASQYVKETHELRHLSPISSFFLLILSVIYLSSVN